MKAVTKSWLPFAILAALTGACGDSGGSNDGEGNGGATAGTNTGDSAGGNTGSTAGGNTGNTAGGNTGSTAGGNTGTNAGGNTGTDADGGTSAGGNAGDGGTGGSDLPSASECGAKDDGLPLDSTAAGGCYYFYCYQTEDSLLAASTQGGACANETDVAIQCEGTSVREVSKCARQQSIQLGLGNRKAVADCVRKNAALDEFSDACLDCNVESAYCAAVNCLSQCLNGDSPACDKCRQDQGCTPAFYQCAGLPDPMM